MEINRKLNFVVPIERDGSTLYAHATPISREVFENYHLVIAKTFSKIYNEGLGFSAGPRVAAMLLKQTAIETGVWGNRQDGTAGVEAGLLGEIRRLTNVIALGPNGWAPFPFAEAIAKGLVDADELSEVENAIVYFTVASAMHRKAELTAILAGAANLWGAQVTSSNTTEFAASLQTSIAIDNLPMPITSLVPS